MPEQKAVVRACVNTEHSQNPMVKLSMTEDMLVKR